MQSLTLQVEKVEVVKRTGHTDGVLLSFDGPNPFPYMCGYRPTLHIDVAQGSGEDYCNRLGLKIDETIDASVKRVFPSKK